MKPMNKLAFIYSEKTISEAAKPNEVLLPLWGLDKIKGNPGEKFKEGRQVVTGEPLIPGVFSTVTGTIKGIEPLLLPAADESLKTVRIEVSETETFDPDLDTVKEPGFLEKEPRLILEKLNRANLGFRDQLDPVKTVIVSAVDTDPLHALYQQVLLENKGMVKEGLTLIRHLTSAEQVVLAVPEPLYDMACDAAGAEPWIDIYKVEPVHPNGLPEMLIKSMAPFYNLENHLFLNIEKLVASVKALQEGQPFMHKIVSVIDENGIRNLRARIGTPIKTLLKDTEIVDQDKVIIGGALSGYSCINTEIPVTEDVDSIYVQHSARGEVIRSRDNQCMSCGKCVRVCPVDLDVNLICRYAEFSLFERCHEMGVEVCIECGLCAFYCPSGRSLVQLIRLAKKEKKHEEQEQDEGR